MKQRKILTLLGGLSALVTALSAQVIPNPSFENSTGLGTWSGFITVPAGSPAIDGWSIGGSAGIDYFASAAATPDPGGGNLFIDLVRGPGQGGSISTTITGLTTGASYRLSFDMNQFVVEAATTIRVDVDAAFQTYLNSTNYTWQTQQFDFTAGSGTATLMFSGPASGADDVGVWIDNVTISAVPEPSTLGLATGCLVLLAVAVGKRRRA